MDEKEWKVIFDGTDAVGQARLRSLCSPYSSSWLLAGSDVSPLPHMTDEQFVTLIRLRLGLQLWDTSQEVCLCGQPTDNYGRHAMRCMKGGYRHTLHNDVRNALYELTKVKYPGMVHLEKRPFDDPAHFGERLDIVVEAGGPPQLIDVACIDSLASAAAINQARKGEGNACTAYEQVKVRKYGEAIQADHIRFEKNFALVPAVFDLFGASGAAAQKSIPGLVRPAGMLYTSHRHAAVPMAMQRVLTALMRGTANLLLRHKAMPSEEAAS